jgi:phage-related protein (TIGR01555 family)
MPDRMVSRPGNAMAMTRKPHGEIIVSNIQSLQARDGLENVVAGLGTSRDKRHYSRYEAVRPLTRYELENMWRCSWVAKKGINIPVEDSLSQWRRFIFEDDDDNEQLDAVEALERTMNIKDKFMEAWCWADLYGGALMIIGVDGQGGLDEPLDVTKVKAGDLKFLHVLDRWRCSSAGTLTMDPTNPNFALPDYYLIAESSVIVHHTRVLRFNGDKLPYFSWTSNARWDDSILQRAYNSVRDADVTGGAIASMIFEANIDVISGDSITDALSTDNGDEKVLKRFQLASLMKSFNRTLLLDKDEKYEKKNNTFTTLDKIWQEMKLEVCGAFDIPYTRFYGQAPAGMDSTGDGDNKNYLKSLASKREKKVDPQINYLDEIMVRSALGAKPDSFKYEWESMEIMDDLDQSTIDFNNAQRDQIYLNMGVVTEGLVASELKAKGVYRSMSVEDVQLAEELAQAPEPALPDVPVPPTPAATPSGNQPGGGDTGTSQVAGKAKAIKTPQVQQPALPAAAVAQVVAPAAKPKVNPRNVKKTLANRGKQLRRGSK